MERCLASAAASLWRDECEAEAVGAVERMDLSRRDWMIVARQFIAWDEPRERPVP
jgi:hypothetical protein